ncbi:MAG TPA: glycosyltransferase family 39 protein [Anaerolineae bacterium]|nr:glycosyltransferase family 39 protein [Anaerolineae bacterium]
MTTSNLPAPSNFNYKQRWLLVGLAALAYLLRLHRLNVESFWFDEALTALFALQPLPVAIQSMLQEGLHHTPLFYILLRPFVSDAFSEFSIRFLPAVLGVLAVPLIAQLGRSLVNVRVGLLTALLLVINPFHLWYSRETRAYTFLMLIALGSMFFFSQNLKASRFRNWAAMAVFTAMGINGHHFAFFIPLIQFVFIIVTFKRNYVLLRPWVVAQLFVALSFIPWTLIVLNWGKFYLSSAAVDRPVLYDLFQTFWNFSVGYTVDLTLVTILSLAFFLLLLGLGINHTYRTDKGVFLILWLVIPPVVTFLVSFRLPTYMDRYLIQSLPPFLLLTAIGITTIRWQALSLAVAALAVTLMLGGVYRVYYDTQIYDRADWRSLATYLEAHATADDVIAPWYYQALVSLYFYYHGATPFEPIISFDKVALPAYSSPGQTRPRRIWVIIEYPNNSSHQTGHCQPFAEQNLGGIPEAKKWRASQQNRLQERIDFTCLRLELYQ